MPDVRMEMTVHARGKMATQLLAAARKLGYPVESIQSQSEGFLVPEEVHRYLFPSEYEEADSGETDRYDAMEFAELREEAKKRELNAGGSGEDIKARLREADDSTPAEDFDPSDLSEAELEALTKPDDEK